MGALDAQRFAHCDHPSAPVEKAGAALVKSGLSLPVNSGWTADANIRPGERQRKVRNAQLRPESGGSGR